MRHGIARADEAGRPQKDEQRGREGRDGCSWGRQPVFGCGTEFRLAANRAPASKGKGLIHYDGPRPRVRAKVSSGGDR
jgi:hypothetical protein